MHQPHRTVVIVPIDLHRRSRKPFVFSLPLSFSLTNKCQKANMISDLQTDLVSVGVVSFRPTHRSRHRQIHSPISPPSNPPTDQWSFTSLLLLIHLSLSFSHDRCLFFRKIEFFLLCSLLIWFIYLDFLL